MKINVKQRACALAVAACLGLGGVNAAMAAEGALPLGYSDAAALPLIGAAADSLSTHIAIASGYGQESNPLVNTSPSGLLGVFIVKAGLIKFADTREPEARSTMLKAQSAMFNGISASNLMIAAGAVNPIAYAVGAVAGWWFWNQEAKVLANERQSARPAPTVQSDEQAKPVAEPIPAGVSARWNVERSENFVEKLAVQEGRKDLGEGEAWLFK